MKQRSHDLKKTKEYAQAMEQVKKNPAAALEAATRAVKSLAIERGLAQDEKSLARLHSWAGDLISMLQPDEKKGLPDHAVTLAETDSSLPLISRGEVTRFLNSRHCFLLAAADYRRRRAELIYKVLLLCEFEDETQKAPYLLRLEDDGETLCIIDQSSVPAETIIDRNFR